MPRPLPDVDELVKGVIDRVEDEIKDEPDDLPRYARHEATERARRKFASVSVDVAQRIAAQDRYRPSEFIERIIESSQRLDPWPPTWSHSTRKPLAPVPMPWLVERF